MVCWSIWNALHRRLRPRHFHPHRMGHVPAGQGADGARPRTPLKRERESAPVSSSGGGRRSGVHAPRGPPQPSQCRKWGQNPPHTSWSIPPRRQVTVSVTRYPRQRRPRRSVLTQKASQKTVFIFGETRSGWAQSAELTPSDPGASYFGFSVSLSHNLLAVASPFGEGTGNGEAWIFQRSGSSWTS